MLKRISFSLLVTGLLLATPFIRASESDPWTYAYIPLADSAVKINQRLEHQIVFVLERVNKKFAGATPYPDDTTLEFTFFSEFREQFIRDVAWGIFERCIGTNDCDGWPQFERIQMYPEESIFGAVRWRYVPARFHLASIIEVCGVRMGADKITHFFDDGFHYFNALRSKRKNLEPEDIRRLSMTYEHTYMGTQLTGIVSRADVEANLTGVRYYSDIFGGETPMVAREPRGRLVLIRQPDICDYVTRQFDERVLPNEYSFGSFDTARSRQRAESIRAVIAQREQQARQYASELSPEELEIRTRQLLTRRILMTRWQTDFPKFRMVGHATGATVQFISNQDFRRVSKLFLINPLKQRKLDDRKPIVIREVAPGSSAKAAP